MAFPQYFLHTCRQNAISFDAYFGLDICSKSIYFFVGFLLQQRRRSRRWPRALAHHELASRELDRMRARQLTLRADIIWSFIQLAL